YRGDSAVSSVGSRSAGIDLAEGCNDRGHDGDDKEESCRRGRAEADILEIDELLARIDRHGRRALIVAGQHVDDIENAQGVESPEDYGDEKSRTDERQGDVEEDLDRMDA